MNCGLAFVLRAALYSII